jgi:colanic acid/amylovoran biosynthesis glycosyltransferase
MSRPATVAHVLRRYRSRTETFIGGQIQMLGRHRPVILCERRAAERFEPEVPCFAVGDRLAGPELRLERVAYRLARRLTEQALATLTEIARTENVRLVHAHYVVDARFFLPLARRLGVPLVVSAYGYDVSSFPRRLFGYGRRYLQPLWREVDLVLAMSEDMRRDLISLGCPPERVRVHYYGIPVERFASPERSYAQRDALTILCCGTLEVKKGQHLVLEALRRLELSGANLPNFHVTLVGDGPMRPRLESFVRDLGWHERVTFAGHVPHHEPRLVDAYRAADAFALPSITVRGDKEGIPGTIAEAMAAGLPVVSSKHAGITELVEDGRSGLLVDEGDIDGLASALGRLLCEPHLRARLGTAAAVRVQTVGDIQVRTRELEAIYDALLSCLQEAPRVRHWR